MHGGHAAVDTASTFAPLEKNCSWHVPKVSPLRRRAGSRPEGDCLFACSQWATIAATVTVRTRQIYFYNYSQHNAGVSHDLWLYNSLFKSAHLVLVLGKRSCSTT